MAAPALGTPGLSYRYVSTIGETEVPYVADTTYLNRPIGIYIHPDSGDFYLTEQLGKRLLKYNSNKTNLLSIGKAGVPFTDDYSFNDPRNVSVAPDGHIWVADYSRLTEYTASGEYVRDVSGFERWATGSGDYEFNGAEAIAFDGEGHMFVADRWNHRVQVFAWTAEDEPVYQTTFGVTGESGNDLNHLDEPVSVVATDSGRVFISDKNNNRVLNCPYDSETEEWTCAELTTDLNHPLGLAYIAPDALFIMDSWNGRIVKCDGTTCDTFAPDIWGTNLAADSAGNLYVTREWDCVVEQIDTDGQSTGPFFGDWNTCYVADNSHFNSPRVEVDAQGNMLILEEVGQRLLKFSPDGTFLWSLGQAGHDTWENDHFNWPHGLDTDRNGNIYVADGWRVQIFNKDGVYQATIGTPPDQPNQTFQWVTDVGVDPNNGNIYVVDEPTHRVLVYNSSRVKIGQIGVTNTGGVDNQHLCWPFGVEVDASSNIYVTDGYFADEDNRRVQKFNSQRQYVKTFGVLGSPGDQNGHLAGPEDVVVDEQGRVYVVEMWNNRVQVFDAAGAYLATIGGGWGLRNGEFRSASDVSIDGSGNVYVSDINLMTIQKFAPGVPGWRQKNINGFGSRYSNVGALEVYNNQLYAGTMTWNNDESGSVWRSTDGKTWTELAAPGVITSVDARAVVDLQTFNGNLYATTEWGDGNNAQVWRYDGTSWTKVLERNPGWLTSLTVFNGQVYVSEERVPEDGGAQILRSSTGNLNSWTPVPTNDSDPNAGNVVGFESFQGRLYAALQNSTDGFEVWRLSEDGTSWDRIITGGFGDSSMGDVGDLAVFGDALYFSGRNDVTGAKVWKTTDGENWTSVTEDGFGNANNIKIEGFLIVQEKFYALMANNAEGLQVWVTSDGEQWNLHARDGLGDISNGGLLWAHPVTLFQGSLYLGTWNDVKGSQIWQMMPNTIYLPVNVR